MTIIYHHWKDWKKEIEDMKKGWYSMPPELICTNKQEEKLLKVWRFFNGKNAYISDPLAHTQCLYIMLLQIPFGKIIKSFIKEEHKYDIE